MPGRVHRLLAQRARRSAAGDGLGPPGGHGPHLRTGGVDARDVAVVVGVRRSVSSASSSARSRSSMSTSSRSGSKPRPISRARKSGTVGSRSTLWVCGISNGQLGVVVGDLVEEGHRLCREQRDLLLLDQHGELGDLGARLDVERALTRLTDRAGPETVDVVELDDLRAHPCPLSALRAGPLRPRSVASRDTRLAATPLTRRAPHRPARPSRAAAAARRGCRCRCTSPSPRRAPRARTR